MSFKLNTLFVLAATTVLNTAVASTTLFTYKGGKITPVLAKMVEKTSETEYKIVLSEGKKVEGKKLTADMVKQSLEAKLAKKLSLMAKIASPDTLNISYKGSEKKFLTRVSRTKITAEAKAGMELASAVSDSSIRAKKGAKGVGPQQIELKITEIKPSSVTGLVLKVGSKLSKDISKGHKFSFKTKSPSKLKKGVKATVSVKKQGKEFWIVEK